MKRKPGPKSTLEKLLESTKHIKPDNNMYIVIYSTKERRPPKDFYRYIKQLREMTEIKNPVRGVLICKGTRYATVIHNLAKKYCGDVMIYKIAEKFA